MSTHDPDDRARPPARSGRRAGRSSSGLRRALRRGALLALLGALPGALGGAGPAAAAEPVTVLDLSREPDTAPGSAMTSWLQARSGRWEVKFGTPAYFFLRDGSLHLVAKPGPMAGSMLFWRLLKREDKVLLRVTAGGFRVRPSELRHLEVTMAPVRLPGKGADVTDPERNDACFYLLVSFDGPRHSYQGQKVPETVAYVWADGAWKAAGEVGRERKYGEFMRYIALGRGDERLGQVRTIVQDVEADFRKAYPERASQGVPDVIEVGLMIDSNTVKSEAESLVRSVRFLP